MAVGKKMGSGPIEEEKGFQVPQEEHKPLSIDERINGFNKDLARICAIWDLKIGCEPYVEEGLIKGRVVAVDGTPKVAPDAPVEATPLEK